MFIRSLYIRYSQNVQYYDKTKYVKTRPASELLLPRYTFCVLDFQYSNNALPIQKKIKYMRSYNIILYR